MVDAGMMQTYGLLTAQAIAPIILGSFKSLKVPRSVRAIRQKSRKSKGLDPDSDDEADPDAEIEDDLDETLTWADTLWFPILGSVALLGFYAVLTYVGKEWINFILGVYFSGAGMFAMQSTFGTLLSFGLRSLGVRPARYHLRISSKLRQVYHTSFTLPSLFLLPLCIAMPALYIPLGRPYIISNLIALSLSTATLQLLRLDSFATAGLLLGVLLVYDIFWVFATPVMVTVAKGLDAPIKLLAPRPSSSGSIDFAMLGLGDVVVPGLMVALCLRFDLDQAVKRHPGRDIGPGVGSGSGGSKQKRSWSKPYFYTGVISYLLGLATTMAVMTCFKKAQPALLYLSPACTLGPLLLAAIRGELKDMWAYTEGDEADKAKVERDETIEPGSEVAQRARAEANAAKTNGYIDVSATEQSDAQDGVDITVSTGNAANEQEEVESWMEGGVAVSGQDGKARKRKGKKK